MVRSPKFQQGFTLFETVIAMTIFALFAVILLMGSRTALTSTDAIINKQMAIWVAENELIQLQQKARLNQLPAVGQSKQTVDMASNKWLLETTVSQTDDEDMYRIELKVFLLFDDSKKVSESSIASLVGFLGKH